MKVWPYIGCIELTKDVPGDCAEFGVSKGKTFFKIAKFAKQHGKKAFAFDSFRGMAKPCAEDYEWRDGKQCACKFPEGMYDQGGADWFRDALLKNKIDNAIVIEGFIPQSLIAFEEQVFSFAHVDLDQYGPTEAALNWVWERLALDGIIVCHDWFPKRKFLAARAIREFLVAHEASAEVVGEEDISIWFRKVK